MTLTSSDFYRANPTLQPVTNSDKIVTYVLLDPCNPPQQIMLEWLVGGSWNYRAYWGANLINEGTDGTNSRRRMGDLPPLGQWVRLEVPVPSVGLVGQKIQGMSFNVYDGRAWFDRTGLVACVVPTGSAPTIPATDVMWVDDTMPEGFTQSGTWNWTTEQVASGTQAHTDTMAAGTHSHSFSGLSGGLTIGVGEKLVAYAFLSPCDPPSEIMLSWKNGGSWEHRAYWGANLMTGGTDGTNSRRRMGDLPPLGQWVRLEVPAALVGLEGVSLRGMYFYTYNGEAWFDAVGKAPATTGSTIGPAAQTSDATEPGPVSLSITARYVETNSTVTMKKYSLYTPELQLLAETNESALTPWIRHEYIWFGGEPLAQHDVTTGEIAYYFNDHLGAPILQTDNTGAVVWRVERDPYGERYATRVGADRHQPLGLPGQEYDASSDRQYNIFRWYRPGWGRYTQADPIGLQGGVNIYAYPRNPNNETDPLGLMRIRREETLHRVAPVWGNDHGSTQKGLNVRYTCTRADNCWKLEFDVVIRYTIRYSSADILAHEEGHIAIFERDLYPLLWELSRHEVRYSTQAQCEDVARTQRAAFSKRINWDDFDHVRHDDYSSIFSWALNKALSR